MVRLVVLWRNEPEDVAAFERHYREVHIPLAKRLPGLRRYTLSRNPSPLQGDPCYCIAELDWDDMAALRRAFDSPEGRAVSDDVANLERWSPGVQSAAYDLDDV